MALELPKLPDVERLSPRVVRILGDNPSKFTLQGTNTYLVGQGSQRVLIDTGEGKPKWAESLKRVLDEEKCSVNEVILTHWHPDHVQGVNDLRKLCPDAKVYKNQRYKSKDIDFQDGHVFTTDGATIKAFYCPGHTADHMALILREEDAMFTGDNVLGHGTAVFEDLAAYMDSLERMQHHFAGRAYPAHGVVIDDGPAKLREYIAHRKEREQQIVDALKDGAKTAMGVVKVVYKDYPENLHAPAEGGVKQILAKLEGESRVRQASGGEWALTDKASL